MLIIFETHATSCDNERGIASGHHDSPLSQLGLEQARQLGDRYVKDTIDLICCSDLSRSYETAKIAFKTRNIPIIQDKRLREWNYGKFNGQPLAKVDRQKSLSIDDSFPEGESLVLAVSRILNFIDEVHSRFYGKTILIIAHRAVFYALEHRYRQLPLLDLVRAPWKWQPGWRYSYLGASH